MDSSIPIQVSNLKKKFKKKIVLDDINITIHANSVYGIVGLNGIGKTTLIKIILGLLSPDKKGGDVKIFGNENSSLKAKRQFCYLPEKFYPSPLLTGEEFLDLSVRYYDIKYNHTKAKKLCKDLDFAPTALNGKIANYSKGMGQKLGLVATFLINAPLLILDEPMSGLDPLARICLKKQIKQYKESGNTVFFSSHILADIQEICDHMSLLHNTKIIYDGNTASLIKKNKSANLEDAFLKSISA